MHQGPMPFPFEENQQQSDNADDILRQIQREKMLLTQFRKEEKRAQKRQNQAQKYGGYTAPKGTLGHKTKNR